MWERYCRGVEVIVFIVDSVESKLLSTAAKELHSLLSQKTLAGVPLLVLLNKNDLENCLKPDELLRELALDSISNREVSYYSISCKNIVNIDKTLEWIIKHSNNNKTKK
jgi:ADP-ribosylation factor-like protein 8